MQSFPSSLVVGFLVFANAGGCKSKDTKPTPDPVQDPSKAQDAASGAAPGLQHDKGVDPAKKRVTIGALNDETGAAAVIGKPYALGKRVLVEAVNAGSISALSPGWTVELLEKDHGYDPSKAQQAYAALENDVLFIATSFGTPNTLPLRPALEKDKMVAFPTSSSSKMAEFELTPPPGVSYDVEARRAMDWAVAHAGAAKKVKAAIVYQQDDYGEDGLAGWKAGAETHGVTIVSEQVVTPDLQDFAPIALALKKAKANYVLLTTLPSATGGVLANAAQLHYTPVWIGNTPAWIDAFFDPEVLPPAVLDNFHWVTGLPYWGEDVPGMKDFVAAWEQYKPADASPDFYTLMSYLQGVFALEAARRAIEAGDVTRQGYLRALHDLESFDAGGMMAPLDYGDVPYTVGTQARILAPKLGERSWTSVADYAAPQGHDSAK